MRIRKFFKLLLLFNIATIAACQSSPTPTNTASPSLTPTIIGKTSAAYPPIDPYPANVPVSTLEPYPAPTLLTRMPLPATRTPIQTLERPADSFPYSTYTPLPQNTQSISYIYLKCTRNESYLNCVDNLLRMQFQYPSRWGLIESVLVNGTCGGFAYSYNFIAGGSQVEAGGVSNDYCEPIGGDLFSMFQGFEPGRGCDLFREAQDCRNVNDRVFIATLFADFQSICSPGPGTLFNPVMVVGINFPENHPVAGLIFSFRFLSIKAKDQLFEPFGGMMIIPGRCSDPKTEAMYTQLVKDLSLKVKEGNLDEETTYLVKGINDFMNSISFLP